MTITVYSTTHCGVCHALMQWLDGKDVPYINKVVDQNDEDMADYMAVNDGMIGTPFTVIEKNGQLHKIQGYDQPRFNQILAGK